MFRADALFFNLFVWTRVMMLKLFVEETKVPISSTAVSMVTICTLAGRRRDHLPPTYEYQKHGERKHNPCRSCTQTRASEQPSQQFSPARQ